MSVSERIAAFLTRKGAKPLEGSDRKMIQHLAQQLPLLDMDLSTYREAIRSFAPEMVDIILAIREHLATADQLDVLLPNICVFFSQLIIVLPHCKDVCMETFAAISKSSGSSVSESVLRVCQHHTDAADIKDYVRSLRILYHYGVLYINGDACMDLGILLQLCKCLRKGSNGPNGDAEECEASLFVDNGREWLMVAYQSLRLLGTCLHIPVHKVIDISKTYLPSDLLAEVLYEDANMVSEALATRLEPNQFTLISNNDNNSNNNGSNESIEEFLYRPHGQPSVHLGEFVLPAFIRYSNKGQPILSDSATSWSPTMVSNRTSISNLKRLMQGVQSSLPILVQGNVGCGKSFLLHELAASLGQEASLIELHLDDCTDSKTLIGTYVCSDVPGEFVWQPGVITQAAMNGHWIIIEDIDKISFEIVAALAPLLERRRLYMPHRDAEVSVHPYFRIFGTRSLKLHSHAGASIVSKHMVPTLRHFSHLFHAVTVDMPSGAEIDNMLSVKFPALLPIIQELLLNTFNLFNHSGAVQVEDVASAAVFRNHTRSFTLRDLMKAAKRVSRFSVYHNHVSNFLTEAQKMDVFNEVIDVFAASCRTPETYITLVQALGKAWDFSESDIESAVFISCPEVQVQSSVVNIGRASLTKSTVGYNNSDGDGDDMNADGGGRVQQFALTKHSRRLLERIGVCVLMDEPALLVGETGSGKTTSVQELADIMRRKLVVQNLSLSTDASDLLGGFRPVSMKQLFQPTHIQFISLFQETFSTSSNTEYLQVTSQLFKKEQWKRLLKAFLKASDNAIQKIGTKMKTKSGKSDEGSMSGLQKSWSDFMTRVSRFEANLPRIEYGFAFAFVDGLLVDAMRKGHWVLLDEINLASQETLQGLTGILDGQSLCLTEKGDLEPVQRHKDFRLFAAMNPPTDVGKKELPIALRSRFTEIYCAEMEDPQDLREVVSRYLSNVQAAPINDIVDIYLGCRQSAQMTLEDSGGQRPRYSLRSLTRSLQAAKAFLSINFRPLDRALLEGFLLNFQTLLGDKGRAFMYTFLENSLGLAGNKAAKAPPSRPGGKSKGGDVMELVAHFWLRTGPLERVDWAEKDEETGIIRFVMTATVSRSIRDLAAAVASRVAPVLLQGPTSVGKTTMIEYLAARTGHKCIRINNHEHTDVQEYIGGYVTSATGQLEFRDGLLVQALRGGHWIILDELNLAPSEVLEALNRLLDDNKELYLPETGETIRPSDGFCLFATQNPPGAYGGRKPLSRAFRNRFLELSICDLAASEIEEIVTHSTGIPPRFSKMLVQTMKDLQLRRQQSSLLQGKYGSVTTRDLIKWGRRQPASALEVAEEGFMLLAEKLRLSEEKMSIEDILNKACKVKMQPQDLYAENLLNEDYVKSSGTTVLIGEEEEVRQGRDDLLALGAVQQKLRSGEMTVEGVKGVAITAAMRRMWRLIGRCLQHNEPALLIGETGSGKTTVCQLFAAHRKQRIQILNCHQSTETSDIIGGLRPVRGREGIFESTCGGMRLFVQGLTSMMSVDQEQLPDVVRNVKVDALREINDCLTLKYEDKGEKEGEVREWKEEIFSTQVTYSLDLEQCLTSVLSQLRRGLLSLKSRSEHQLTLVQQREVYDKAAAKNSRKKERKSKKAKTKADDTPSNNNEEDGDANEPPLASIESEDVPLWKDMHSQMVELVDSMSVQVEDVQTSLSRYRAIFEWQDGPLVTAMKEGHMFLLDEINLAEDAVIERLNSVLESGREITLAEKGGSVSEKVVAHPDFKFLATMNPGGDFGKRELSPALRSRFSEIWVPTVDNNEDLARIVQEIMNLPPVCAKLGLSSVVAQIMVEFVPWVVNEARERGIPNVFVSIREVLAWARFVSHVQPTTALECYAALMHGAHMVLLDGFGLGIAAPRETIQQLQASCVSYLLRKCPKDVRNGVQQSISVSALSSTHLETSPTDRSVRFCLGTFSIPAGTLAAQGGADSSYILDARSTKINLHRILRAMQLPRPILLEGPPGVGKTSIISNLAARSGHKLVRINLSEHSEISDLLGTDLPASTSSSASGESKGDGDDMQVEETTIHGSGDAGPKFKWCDGIFLSAMKAGDWVLLDELNLAPQSVLEGLNACFDHREEVYLPEIGKTFKCAPTFRVFCAQNPMVEGGGRKGLPQSFLTRFSRVFVDAMTEKDMEEIASSAFPRLSLSEESGVPEENDNDEMDVVSLQRLHDHSLHRYIPRMVSFIRKIHSQIVDECSYGSMGSPWEFNLRDVFRWCEVVASQMDLLKVNSVGTSYMSPLDYVVADAAYMLFLCRMRDQRDREAICVAFEQIFSFPLRVDTLPGTTSAWHHVYIGSAVLQVSQSCYLSNDYNDNYLDEIGGEDRNLVGGLEKLLETIAHSVCLKWPVLLVGAAGSGKRRCVRKLATLGGRRLVEYSATSSTDSTDLLGSFEQVSASRTVYSLISQLELIIVRLSFPTVLAMNLEQESHSEAFMWSVEVASMLQRAKSLSLKVTSDNRFAFADGVDLRDVLFNMLDLLDNVPNELQTDKSDDNLSEIRGQVEKCFDVDDNGTKSGFEWVDGIVVKAVRYGHWLLVDNVNLCSSSVLDRLNSLLEPNGNLLLTEGGGGRTIEPHANFRVFFTMDPQYGEISRAMRNRCIELSIVNHSHVSASASMDASDNQEDVVVQFLQSLLSNAGEQQSALQQYFIHVYRSMVRDMPPSFPRTKLFGRFVSLLLVEFSRKGHVLDDASIHALSQQAMYSATSVHIPLTNIELPDTSTASHKDDYGRVLQLVSHMSSVLPRSIYSHLVLLVYAVRHSSLPMHFISNTDTGSFLDMTLSSVTARSCHGQRSISKESVNIASEFVDMVADEHISAVRVFGQLRAVYAQLQSPSDESDEKSWLLHFIDLVVEDLASISNSTVEDRWTACSDAQSLFQAVLGPTDVMIDSTSYQTSTQSRYSMANQLTHVSINGEASVPTVAQLDFQYRVKQITCYARMDILTAELQAREYVDNLPSISQKTKLPSLYAVAYALSRELLVANSQDLRMLYEMYVILGVVDAAALRHVAEMYTNSNPAALQEVLLKAIERLLAHRDAFASLLLQPLDYSSKSVDYRIPWQRSLIIIRWIHKSAMVVKETTENEGGRVEEFVLNLYEVLAQYWKQPVLYHQKFRMWKDGGHPVVPFDEAGWQHLASLRSILMKAMVVSEERTDTAALPGFSEKTMPFGLPGLIRLRPHGTKLSLSLLREWLALYSTVYCYYFSRIIDKNSMESYTDLGMASEMNLSALVDGMDKKVKEALLVAAEVESKAVLDIKSEVEKKGYYKGEEVKSDKMDTDEYQMMLESADLTQHPLLSKAEQEFNTMGDVSIILLVEPHIIESLLSIRNSLSTWLHASWAPNVAQIRAVVAQMRQVVDIVLRYTCFDPSLLQEFQAVLWALEALPKSEIASATKLQSNKRSKSRSRGTGVSKDTSNDAIESVKLQRARALIRSVLYAMDAKLFSMVHRNVNNISKALEFTYISPSLEQFLEPSEHDEGELDEKYIEKQKNLQYKESLTTLSFSDLATNGHLMVLQPVYLKTVLKHVDVSTFRSAPVSRTSLSLLTHNIAAFTVSTYAKARTKLFQMFRTIVAVDTSSGGSNVMGRLESLVRLAVDVVYSARESFSKDTKAALVVLVAASTTATGNVNLNMCQSLQSMHLINNLRDSTASERKANVFTEKLLRTCINPVLDILSQSTIYRQAAVLDTSPQPSSAAEYTSFYLTMGKCWTLLGMAQMHMTLPTLPVDPATKMGVKAALLRSDLVNQCSATSLRHALSVISGESPVTTYMSNQLVGMQSMKHKMERYKKLAIERPADVVEFSVLFSELNSMAESLGNMDEILLLLSRTSDSYNESMSSLNDKSLATLLQCCRQEVAWQSNASAVLTALTSERVAGYTDILAPILSSIYNISYGLRVFVGTSYHVAEDAVEAASARRKVVSEHTLCPSEDMSVNEVWQSIIGYPFSAPIDVSGGNISAISNQALSSIDTLLRGKALIVSRAQRVIQQTKEAQSLNNKKNSTANPPNAGIVDTTYTGHMYLTALSKIDYFLGGGTLNPLDSYDLFNTVLSEFVDSHLRTEDARKAAEEAKNALYKHKAQESNFESNEEKEEDEAYKAHFPDHLTPFHDILAQEKGAGGESLFTPDRFAVQPENNEGMELDALHQEFDTSITSKLIAYHARMVFFHFKDYYARHGRIYTRTYPRNSVDSTYFCKAIKDSAISSLHAHSLMLAKSVEWSLHNLVSPGLAGHSHGASLLALASMTVPPESYSSAQYKPKKSGIKGLHIDSAPTIDRDLLTILFHDDIARSRSKEWKPINFHLDANPQEVIRASGPLSQLFRDCLRILTIYPGNDVILQIMRVSTRISNFHISTPLGKMLISLQLLSKKVEEWELYAASHVSLSNSHDTIKALIATWREIELSSWDELLRCKEIEYTNDAMQFWYSLARVVRTLPQDKDMQEILSDENEKVNISKLHNAMRAKDSATSYQWPALLFMSPGWLLQSQSSYKMKIATEEVISEKSKPEDEVETVWGRAAKKLVAEAEAERNAGPMGLSTYSQNLFDIIDAFVRKSTCGQFPARLHIIRIFGLQLADECTAMLDKYVAGYGSSAGVTAFASDRSAESQAALHSLRFHQKRCNIVLSIWQYYNQFLPIVRRFQDMVKGPILTKVRGEVKLGKWDQMNTYALLEHSEKVHRKLNKLIREYQKDVLDIGVWQLIRKEIVGELVSEHGDLQASIAIPSHLSLFSVVMSVDKDVKKKAKKLREIKMMEEVPVKVEEENDDDDNKEMEQLNVDAIKMEEEEEEEVNEFEDFMEALTPGAESTTHLRKLIVGDVFSATTTSSYPNKTVLSKEVQKKHPNILRMDSLGGKVLKYLKDILVISTLESNQPSSNTQIKTRFSHKARFGLQSAFLAEDLCDNVFVRINSLRAEGVPRPAKHRAVHDLFDHLKEQGVSYLRGTIPVELRNPKELLATPAPLPLELFGDLEYDSGKPRGLLQRGEGYFMRIIAELMEFRTQSVASHSPDLSFREVQIMAGFGENLFKIALEQRMAITAALEDFRELQLATNKVRMFSTTSSGSQIAADSKTVLPSKEYIVRASGVVLDSLLQVQRVLESAIEANRPENMESETAIVAASYGTTSCLAQQLQTCVALMHELRACCGRGESQKATDTDASVFVLGQYALPSTPSSDNSDTIADPALLEALQAIDLKVKQALADLTATREDSIRLVSGSVFSAMVASVQSMSSYLDKLSLDGEETSHRASKTSVDEAAVQQLASCIDNCLTITQRLTRHTSEYTQDGGKKVPDITSALFGGALVAQSTKDDLDDVLFARTVGEDEGEMEEEVKRDLLSLKDSLSMSMGALSTFKCSKLTSALHALCLVSTNSPNTFSELVTGLYPMLSHIQTGYNILLNDLCASYKSTNKMAYVCLRVFRTLLAKGFCDAKSKDGDGDGNGDTSGMTFTDDVEGTGMGEGDGKQDVSDQIQNEEQLLGLDDDKPKDDDMQNEKSDEKDPLTEEEQDKGVEMSGDFEGDMHDLEEKEEEEQPKGDDDDDQEEELDREMGNANAEDIVDEKQWNSDDDDEGEQDEDEKFEKDSKMKGEAIEGETRTKEEQENDEEEGGDDNKEDNPKEEDKREEKEKDSNAMDEDNDDEGPINEDNEDDEIEKPMGVDVRQDDRIDKEEEDIEDEEQEGEAGGEEGGAAMDEEGEDKDPEDGAEDLPDDMNLDGGDANDADDADNDEDGLEANGDMDLSDADEEEKKEGEEDSAEAGGDSDNEEEKDAHVPEEEQIAGGAGNETEEKEPGEEDKEEAEKDEKSQNNSQQNPKQDNPPAYGVRHREEHTEPAEAVLGVEDDAEEEETESPDETNAGPEGKGSKSHSNEGKGQNQELDETIGEELDRDNKQSKRNEKEPPNPFKQKGDVNKAWHKRLNVVMPQQDPASDEKESEESEENEEDNSGKDGGEDELKDKKALYEYTQDSDDDIEQVLGGAPDEEEADKLDIGDMDEEEKKDEDGQGAFSDEESVPDQNKDEEEDRKRDRKDEEEKQSQRKKIRSEEDRLPPPPDKFNKDKNKDKEGEKEDADDMQEEEQEDHVKEDAAPRTHTDTKFRMGASTMKLDPDASGLDQEGEGDILVGIDFDGYGNSVASAQEARDKWNQYRMLTESHSMRLCEQLRLILEPTTATRLQGDYRTGKRINMRRVIQYIASGFRKDKIWLRRMKPAKREYQVMIMIDDSKSMGSAGPLALSALSIISNALSRLEVGEISVVSFADTVKILHPFGRPFSDESGAKVFSHFSFTGENTFIGASLNAMVPVFDEASANSNSNNGSANSVCLQICFIVSDARIDSENREQLDAVVKSMAERNILAVLVILDEHDNPRNSILNTKSITFEGENIVSKNYLDDFPFPFYITCQKLDILPDVLTDALKQWFELISSQIDN